MRAVLPVLIGLAMASAACASDFDPSSRITGYRILAVRADQPFARPGERVTLEALAVDGADRPFMLAWSRCTRPASTTASGCLDALDDTELVQGPALTRHELAIPADVLDGVPAAAASLIAVGAVQVQCPGPVERQPGPEGLPLRCTDGAGAALALGEYDLGVKRVYVRTVDRNANPELAEVLFDGEPWPPGERRTVTACSDPDENRFDRCDGPAHDLAVRLADGSLERGVDQFGVEFAETAIVQYYATEGLFEYEVKDARAPATRYRARAGAAGGPVTLWFVVRDDRGGVTWTSRTLDVVAP